MDNGEPSYEEDFFKPGTIIQIGSRDSNDNGNDEDGDEFFRQMKKERGGYWKKNVSFNIINLINLEEKYGFYFFKK